MDVLTRIKRLVIARQIEFTVKAEIERIGDGLCIRKTSDGERFYVFISSKISE